jgi:hypothetical protein
MNKQQKKLLCAATDLCASLSRGQLKRVLKDENQQTICVRPEFIRDLHAAAEAIYPGLIEKARTVRDEWAAARAEKDKKTAAPVSQGG